MEYSFFFLLFLELLKGVYISPSAAMSLGYSRLQRTGSTTTMRTRDKFVPPLLRTTSNVSCVFQNFLLFPSLPFNYIYNIYTCQSYIYSLVSWDYSFFLLFFFEKHTHTGRKFIFIGSKCESDGIM